MRNEYAKNKMNTWKYFIKVVSEGKTFWHECDISLKWPTSHDTFFVCIWGQGIVYYYPKHIVLGTYRVPKYGISVSFIENILYLNFNKFLP